MTWNATIYEIQPEDPVEGGPTGVDNIPHQQLAQNCEHLKDLIEGGAMGGQLGSAQLLLSGVSPLHAGYVRPQGQTLAPGAYDPSLAGTVLPHHVLPVTWAATGRALPANQGLPAGAYTIQEVAASGAERMVLRTNGQALLSLYSADSGATWTTGGTIYTAGAGTPSGRLHRVSTGWVCVADAVYHSADNGATWTQRSALPGGGGGNLVGFAGDRLMLGGQAGQPGVHVSADGGSTWAAVDAAALSPAGVWDATAARWVYVTSGRIDTCAGDGTSVATAAAPATAPTWFGRLADGRYLLVLADGSYLSPGLVGGALTFTKATSLTMSPTDWTRDVLATSGAVVVRGVDAPYYCVASGRWATGTITVGTTERWLVRGADLEAYPASVSSGVAAPIEEALAPGGTSGVEVPTLASPVSGMDLWLRVL